MALLTLIRHGQSLFNQQNRFTGEQDVPLTAEGGQEAMRAGQQLQKLAVVYHAAFTSDLQRAQESLKIILSIIGSDHKISEVKSTALNERNDGVLQGRNKAEAAVEFSADDIASWRRSYSAKPPGEESLEDTYHRVISYFHPAFH